MPQNLGRLEPFHHLARSNINLECIVEDLITPGGWTFFVGETGAGKSIMMIQLCSALQEGKSFLGFKTKQQNCIYFQADAGLIEWKKQIERLAPQSSAWTVHQVDRGCLDDSETRKRFHNIVWGTYAEDLPEAKALKGARFTFIVFDCLHALTNKDINTKTSMSEIIKALDEIATLKVGDTLERVHYILVHHPNATVTRGATAGSGHKGFSDACATKFTLGNNMLVLEKSKLFGKKEILLDRDLATGGWLLPSEAMENSEDNLNRLLGI